MKVACTKLHNIVGGRGGVKTEENIMTKSNIFFFMKEWGKLVLQTFYQDSKR